MKKKILSNYGLKILAFIIAIFMWFIVVNVNDPEITKQFSGIEVSVTNQEILSQTEKTLQLPEDRTVTVTVKAKRSVMQSITADKIKATADLNDLMIRSLIPITVQIEGYEGKYTSANANPTNLEVTIDDEERASFPITPVDQGTVRDGNVLSEMKANPESVVLRGPKNLIDNISRVTAEVNVSGLSKDATLDATMRIYDNNDNIVDPTMFSNNLGDEGLTVSVTLMKVKTVKLNFDDSLISAGGDYEYSGLSYEPKEIEIVGKEEDLEDLTEIDIPASALKSEGITEKTDKTVDIADYLPDDIELYDKNVGTIVVTINVDLPGAKTFEVATSGITVKNLASDLDPSFESTVDIEIQVKGEQSALDVLSLANKVSIDLKKYTEPGTYTVPVSVELPSGISLVKSVEVKVILTKKSSGG